MSPEPENVTTIPDAWGDTHFDLIEDDTGTRRFSDATLQSHIDSAIARRNPDKKIIAIAHGEAGDDAQAYLSLAVKLNDQWSIAAAAYKKFNGSRDWGVGAEVVWEA